MNTLHREVIVMDHDIRHQRMSHISASGALLNKYDVLFGLDLHVLPNGNVLVNERQAITELAPDLKTVVWRYEIDALELMSCTRLENGNTLIGDISIKSIYELTPQLEKVWQMPFPYDTAAADHHELFRMIRPLRNGNLMVAWHEKKKIAEFTKQGELTWSFDLEAGPYEAIELEGGNILASVGPAGKIVEVSRERGLVWEFDMEQDAGLERGWIAGICCLASGNIVFSDSKWDRLVEITRNKEVVGLLHEPEILLHPSSLAVLSEKSRS